MNQDNDLLLIELNEENLESMIYEIRGQRVMLDFDLARIYGYSTRDFNNQIKHNIERFPDDFMFQLTLQERNSILRLKKFTANELSSKRRYNPYAFTEKGIYMLMTVLRGELAIKQSIMLIRLFERMKNHLASFALDNGGNLLFYLSNKVNEHDKQFEIVGNKLDVIMKAFSDSSLNNHCLLLDGQRVEADLTYQEIYKTAKSTILVIDNYVDVKTLQLLKSCNRGVKVTIFTTNKAKNNLTKQYVDDFIKDTGLNILLKKNNNRFHDRYIVIDYKSSNEIIYHCGSSSKDAGSGVTSINKIDVSEIYHGLIDEILNSDILELDDVKQTSHEPE